jgi:hypothetical protein
MKKLTYILLITLSIFTFNCTNDGAYEDASEFNTEFAARFINESAANVDLVVYDFDGNVLSTTNDIRPGGSYELSSLNPEETTFRIVTELSDRFEVLNIEDTNKYYVVLDNDNLVSTIQTARL